MKETGDMAANGKDSELEILLKSPLQGNLPGVWG